MLRSYVRKVGGRAYQNYDIESLDKAVNAILKTNISIRHAAEQFQVPRSTISDHLMAHKSNNIIKEPDKVLIFEFSQRINKPFNMLRFLCKPHIIAARNLTVQTLSRSMAGQAPQKMEEYSKDKKIIVTGSCAGMGEKITERLLDLGTFVYAVVEKEEGAAKALPRTKQIFCDVLNWEDTYKKMYDIGPVHGLVNNAGVAVIE